jgi:hypothetical protein
MAKWSVYQPEGYPFDFYTIGDLDWPFLFKYVITNGIKTVFEFGSGLSSVLLSQICRVVALENWPEFAEKVRRLAVAGSDLDIRDWDGKNFPAELSGTYDLVIIDGPDPARKGESSGEEFNKARLPSFIAAPSLSDRVFVHDASWHQVALYQINYLAAHYNVREIYKSDSTPDIRRYSAVWERRRA